MQIRNQLVASRAKTYGSGNACEYITVHETANRNRGANAQAHANLQSRGNVRNASWHIQVDDKEAIRSFPDDVRCWHAGDGRGPGGYRSLALEICVNADGNYEKALANAAEVVKQWRAKYGIPASKVVQHNRWSGKNCPTILRGRGAQAWRDFVAATDPGAPAKPVSKPAPVASKPAGGATVAQLAQEVLAGKHGTGNARRRSLGSRYAAVQAEVNRLLRAPQSASRPAGKSVAQMAQEVLDGRHGNGHHTRRRSLGVSAGVYEQVRAEVNRRAAGGRAPASRPAGKSVAQMAAEVIRGQHGNGHETRRRSLGISAALYAQVRAAVNRQL